MEAWATQDSIYPQPLHRNPQTPSDMWRAIKAPWLCLGDHFVHLHSTCNHLGRYPLSVFNTWIILATWQYTLGSDNGLQRTWMVATVLAFGTAIMLFWTNPDFLQLVCVLPWEIYISSWHPSYIFSGYHGDKELLPWLWEWLVLEFLSSLSQKALVWNIRSPFSPSWPNSQSQMTFSEIKNSSLKQNSKTPPLVSWQRPVT